MDAHLIEDHMQPQSLILQYWKDVEDLLVNRYKLKSSEARIGIGKFLDIAEQHQFADVIYHHDVEETAMTIAGGMEVKGFLRHGSKQSQARKRKRVLVQQL
jgi:hypothetical protein